MASRSQASSLGVWIADQDPPMRAVRLGQRDVTVDQRPDGTIYLRPRQGLGLYPQRLTDRLDYWAHVAPERTFLAQRTAAGPGVS